MTLPANLNVYISAAVFVIGAYIFALYAGLIVWTVRDIRRRSRDFMAQIMAVLLVGLFTVPGLLVYMLLRPQTTLSEEYERGLAEESLLQDLDQKRVCPGCRRQVEADFVVCPHCHQQLRLRCVGCGRLLSPDWDVCPYCGLYREQGEHKQAKGRRKSAGRGADKATGIAQAAPATVVEAPVAVEPPATAVEPEVGMPADYTDEPAGELPRIDADEVTRRLDEMAAQGAMTPESEGDDVAVDEPSADASTSETPEV
jgi:RNA polymerase subunit RPABC4/transcription elongation factor Spt4